MFDKVLVAGGILLGSILFIENMVITSVGYLFLYNSVKTWIIVFVGILIGAALWYGIRWLLEKKEYSTEEDYDIEIFSISFFTIQLFHLLT